MDRIKCRNCDFVNFATDYQCRRCGNGLGQKAAQSSSGRSPRQAAKESSSFYTIVGVLIAIAIGAYFYSGVQKSVNTVQANDQNRLASQANQKSEPLSRTEYDQKRAGQYGNAIQDSPGIAASQKRLAEQQKLMSPQTK